MKANIHFHVPADAVPQKVAHEFRPLIDLKRLDKATYTVICYPGMRGESQSIIDSRSMSKALSKASVYGEAIVAIAHSFTAEALDLLEAQNAIAFYKSSHFWSDESWAYIRDKK